LLPHEISTTVSINRGQEKRTVSTYCYDQVS
jgi:hypothetical protein